jgi:glutathione synthase/RimK-type ligase-like ATP-grasp enzyme
MKILIATMSADFHAATVGLEMQRRGHQVDSFFGEDFPQSMTLSAIHSSSPHLYARSNSTEIDLNSYDVVWNRRRMAFTMPEGVHERDREFVRHELRALSDAVWAASSSDAFWVNPNTSMQNARHKLVQLNAARQCGLTCPETLISNSYEDVVRLIRCSPEQQVIYKSLRPGIWGGEDGNRSLMATMISESHLPDPDTFQLCPGIFQSFVKKRYEIRVTVFGRTMMALKLNSASALQTIDSREQCLRENFATEPYQVPAALRDQIIEMMSVLKLRFGCFDFARAEDGSYCFFEVNEAGQFLWQEQLQPSLPLLNGFCSYLESMDDNFEFRPNSVSRTLADWNPAEIERAMRPLQAA